MNSASKGRAHNGKATARQGDGETDGQANVVRVGMDNFDYAVAFADKEMDGKARERVLENVKSIMQDKGLERELVVAKDDISLPSPFHNAEETTATTGLKRVIIDAEAVVKLGRQSLLVVDGTIENPWSYQVKSNLMLYKPTIDRGIDAVGAVIIREYGNAPLGTAWLIGDRTILTNRHVATECARHNKVTNKYMMTKTVLVNFTGEYKNEHDMTLVFKVDRPLFIADPDDEDYAVFALEESGNRLPTPIPLRTRAPAVGEEVLAIGFPGKPFPGSPGNATAAEQAENDKIFRGIYDVKRVSPGLVTKVEGMGKFCHDCSTLPGSSGSLLLDPVSGAAIGLHYAGSSFDTAVPANYAVSSAYLFEKLNALVALPHAQEPSPLAEEVSIRTISARDGYDIHFLGESLTVDFPAAKPDLQGEIAEPGILHYTNFSILMHQSRRLAIFTAVNIDGENSMSLKRSRDVWSFDSRLDQDLQVGNEFYSRSGFDRGHLVRRLDPVWGSKSNEAEKDTFVFTNCTPQWPKFNQQMWLGLEDYLLESARTHGFKISVFTGPIFGDDDPEYREVRIPRAYWKVAVMISESSGNPVAAGYVISQSELLPPYVEFAIGQFKTYQVKISFIESKTNLDFGDLKDFDPLNAAESHGTALRELESPEDMVL